MARPRRRMTRRPRQRRDWVYRGHAQGLTTTAFADALGSYEGNILTINSGVGQAQTRVLYDSTNYLGVLGAAGKPPGAFGTVTTARTLSRASRAEGRKPIIHAVDGFIYMEATAWALGNLIAAGVRIGVFEQDNSGVISLDTGYSMWVNETVAPYSRVDQHANSRSHVKEWRRHHFFTNTTPSAMILPIRWRGRRALAGNECFATYIELESTSVNVRAQFWLRTLVTDEG